MEIILDSAKEVIVKVQETKTVSEIKVREVKNTFTQVIAQVSFDKVDLISREIVLWEGTEYKKLGEYTEEDVQKRILLLI